MNSYLEAGQRIGYPEQLLRVDTVGQLDEALCHVAPTSVCARLQRLSKYAGSLASPTLSANTLLQEVCSLVGELNMSRASRGVSFKTVRAPAAAHAMTAHHAAANAAAPALAPKPPAAAAEHSVAGGAASAASTALAQGDRALAQASNANRRFGPEVPEDAAQAGAAVQVTSTQVTAAPGVAPESAEAAAAAAAAKLEMRETRETWEAAASR